LISLLATTLSLRLVFEQGLFGYKFLALAVMVLVLDLVAGRIRELTLVWLALVTLVFNPVPAGLAFNARSFGGQLYADLAPALIIVGIAVFLAQALRGRFCWWLLCGLIIAVAAFANVPLDVARSPWPIWVWQVILLSSGVGLAVSPLLTESRVKERVPEVSVREVTAGAS
jgi:hypothetical protein